jgi:hypothetical protein
MLYHFMIYISFDIGVKNLAVCILKHDSNVTIIDWDVIRLADTKKELKSIDELSERIFMALDEIIGKLKTISMNIIDMVLIENQPSNLNGIMKTVQYIIYTYFSLLKYWDNSVYKVEFINASHKLKNHSYVPSQSLESISKKNTKGFTREKYKWNKESSIQICQHYIDTDETLKKYFNNNKKKDDLSDCCLQAISYIRSKSPKDHLDTLEKIKLNHDNFFEGECVN